MLMDILPAFSSSQKFFFFSLFVFLAGLAPRGGGPQYAAALAPDLLVAGVTALVPALTPPDRQVFCLLIPSDLLDTRPAGVPAFPDLIDLPEIK